MSKLLYLKVLMMVIALIAIFYLITNMTPDKVAQSMSNIGVASPEAGAPAKEASRAAKAEQINLCPTRVHAIVWPDGRKIQEAKSGLKMKWQAFNLNPVDLGYMDVEKWLSLHCEVSGTLRSPDEGEKFAPLVTIEYIDGTVGALSRAKGDHYGFAGTSGPKSFESPDLTKALDDLITLAQLQPLGP